MENICIWDLGTLAVLGTVRDIFYTIQCINTADGKTSNVSAGIHTKQPPRKTERIFFFMKYNKFKVKCVEQKKTPNPIHMFHYVKLSLKE